MGCTKGSEKARRRLEIAMRTECRGCRAEGNIVHWRGMRWLGYPWPKRLVLAVRGAWAACVAGDDPQPAFAWRLSEDYLPGCGCIVRARAFAARIAAWWASFWGVRHGKETARSRDPSQPS